MCVEHDTNSPIASSFGKTAAELKISVANSTVIKEGRIFNGNTEESTEKWLNTLNI